MNTVFLNWDQLATDSSLKEVFAKNERGYIGLQRKIYILTIYECIEK